MRRLFTLCALAAPVVLAVMWGFGCQASPAVQHYDRGTNLAEAGQYEQAIVEFDKAIELDPNYPKVYANRGLAYSSLGEYDKAIADYSKAIELDSNYAKAYYNRGLAYKSQGREAEAIADFQRVVTFIDAPELVKQAQQQIGELSK